MIVRASFPAFTACLSGRAHVGNGLWLVDDCQVDQTCDEGGFT